jgi:hypothetical protein
MKKALLLVLVPFLSGCGLILVEGPAPGWETANAEDLEAMAVTNPCTASRTLPRADFVLSAAYLAGAFYPLLTDAADRESHSLGWRLSGDDTARNILGITALGLSVAQVFSGLKGNNKVRDCRAFNARMLQAGRGDAVGQATYEWPDELFPTPALGVAAFDPVFGLPLNLADGN